jgi:quercetin dioxygenase-like cupin family protein
MFFFHKNIKNIDMGGGVLRQDFAEGQHLNIRHWNMANGSEVKLHTHPEEQFGYVIKGGFMMVIGNETKKLASGDGYLIPSNVPHSFVAIGETEALDVFSPVRKDLPGKE